MKKVFSNAMVAHVWAQGTQEEGRNSSDTLYFRGRTIYSYRDSWPLAYIDESGVVIINNASVSVSTAKHRSLVVNALPTDVKKLYVDSAKVLLEVSRYLSNHYAADQKCAYNAITQWVERAVNDYLFKAAKRRCMYRRTDDLEEAMRCLSTGEDVAYLIDQRVEYQHPFALLRTNLTFDTETLLAGMSDRIKANKEAEKERKAKRLAEDAEHRERNIAEFRSGAARYSNYAIDETLLRVQGDIVQTSRGAEFPLQDAINAFPLICRVHDGGFDYVPTPGVTKQKLGHFSIDKIEANGNVTAGCHYVKWDEIERLAQELGLITTK